jgi:hypothetical protein
LMRPLPRCDKQGIAIEAPPSTSEKSDARASRPAG